MVPFLNLLKVHTACLGNHDFDFGIDELEYTIGSCNFPWLLTNVFERSSSDDQHRMDKYLHEPEHPQDVTGGTAANTRQSTHVTGGVGAPGSSHGLLPIQLLY